MEARIVVDLGTGAPPYEQIRGQVASLIAVGELAPGTRLPTVRSLAGDLGVAAGTVARAYKGLEEAGLVVTNRRQGTVVADAPSAPGPGGSAEGQREVAAAVEHLVEAGRRAGLDDGTLLHLLQRRLRLESK